MTRDQLRSLNCKQLAEMARRRGVAGWHDLRKEQLVEALTRSLRNEARRKKPAGPAAPLQPAAARSTTESAPTYRVTPVPQPLPQLDARSRKDRLVLLVRGPYWLSCHWELTPQAVERAEAALGQDWHTAKPILRLLDVTGGEAGRVAERPLRDIPIHGGVNSWYIDVLHPPHSYRVDIGYLTRNGRFYVLTRSDAATTPKPGAGEPLEDRLDGRRADRLAAMTNGFEDGAVSRDVRQFLEERTHRPLGAPSVISLGSGGLLPPGRSQEFTFRLEADLVVHGQTRPGSRVQLQNHPVELNEDGSFALRFKLPDNRQILRCVAVAPDGGEERTVVVAVERNIRHLEPAPLHEVE
ncbi:MAG: DUF4912 domain-containing protein [Gemmataceae bacterium]